MGIVVALVTLPGWFFNPEGTKQLVESFFERPKTDSLKIFGIFKEQMTVSAFEDRMQLI